MLRVRQDFTAFVIMICLDLLMAHINCALNLHLICTKKVLIGHWCFFDALVLMLLTN